MSVASIIATVLLALLFLFTSSIKLLHVDKSFQIRDHLGRTPQQWTAIGLLELLGVAGLLVGFAYQPLATAAAAGLGLLGLGALASHIRAKDSAIDSAAAVMAIALSATTLLLYATT